MDLNGSWQQKTGAVSASDKDALLLYKLVFTTTNVTVSMWINPPLTGEGSLPAADKVHSAAHSTNITSMNVSLGGNSTGFQFDEFRMGTTYATVTPSGPPPQQPATEDIVLFAANATNGPSSQWQKIPDSGAGGGFKMYLPQTAGTQATVLGSPTDYFELTFSAPAGVPYRMWVRMKADNNDPLMDSCYAQFDHTVNVAGTSVIRIGGGSGETPRLQEATGRSISNWGWAINGFGARAIGNAIIFGTGGTQKIRIQKAEPGVHIDRIVLSPAVATYFTKRPGTLLDDTSNLGESTNGATPGPRSTTQLRVLEANIHKYRTTAEDGAEPDRTVSEFVPFDADVIGTNETESNYAGTLKQRLEDKTGVPWYRHYDGVDQHILTRIPFAKVGDVPTNPDDVETRTASTGVAKTVRARIKFNNRSIQFFVVHHDFDTPSNRTIERNELLAHMNEFPSDQRIALGDFNATSTSGEMSGFETSCVDLWKAAVDASTATAYPPDNSVSYHTRTRSNRLDYIFRHNSSTLLSVAGASIPDMRDPRTFEADGTATGISILLGTPDDKGIRASDHNWMFMKINVN
jgi:endonuclease/exonuclease/phosphatase family metal-dependent hydrolase